MTAQPEPKPEPGEVIERMRIAWAEWREKNPYGDMQLAFLGGMLAGLDFCQWLNRRRSACQAEEVKP